MTYQSHFSTLRAQFASFGARGDGNFVLIRGRCRSKSAGLTWIDVLGGTAEVARRWRAEAEIDNEMKI